MEEGENKGSVHLHSVMRRLRPFCVMSRRVKACQGVSRYHCVARSSQPAALSSLSSHLCISHRRMRLPPPPHMSFKLIEGERLVAVVVDRGEEPSRLAKAHVDVEGGQRGAQFPEIQRT